MTQAPAPSVTLRPYTQSLPLALLRAREAVMARLRPLLRAHDLTEQQWRVLRTLSEMEDVEVTALAEQVFLLPSSLSRILRDLSQRDLITRRSVAADLRRGLIRISEGGLKLIAAVAPDAAAANREIERLAGAAEIEDLKRRLSALEAALGGAGAVGG